MKYFFLVLFVSLSLLGCSKKNDNKPTNTKNDYTVDTTNFQIKPADNPAESFSLIYKFEKGKHYKYRMAIFTQDQQVIKTDTTMTQNLNRSVVYNVDVSLAGEDNQGNKQMSCEVTSILIKNDVNGKLSTYESGVTKDSNTIAENAEYDAIVNNPFNVKIGANGGILEISNIDNIVNKFLSDRKAKSNVTTDQKTILKNSLSEGSLRPLMIQIFREMPNKPLAKDSAWSVTQPTAPFLIFKIDNTNTYKIDGLNMFNNDKVAVIDAGLKSLISGNTQYKEQGAEFNFKKPETSANGKIYFNITRGHVQRSVVSTNLKIFYTMAAPSPKGIQKGSKLETIVNKNIVELL